MKKMKKQNSVKSDDCLVVKKNEMSPKENDTREDQDESENDEAEELGSGLSPPDESGEVKETRQRFELLRLEACYMAKKESTTDVNVKLIETLHAVEISESRCEDENKQMRQSGKRNLEMQTCEILVDGLAPSNKMGKNADGQTILSEFERLNVKEGVYYNVRRAKRSCDELTQSSHETARFSKKLRKIKKVKKELQKITSKTKKIKSKSKFSKAKGEFSRKLSKIESLSKELEKVTKVDNETAKNADETRKILKAQKRFARSLKKVEEIRKEFDESVASNHKSNKTTRFEMRLNRKRKSSEREESLTNSSEKKQKQSANANSLCYSPVDAKWMI